MAENVPAPEELREDGEDPALGDSASKPQCGADADAGDGTNGDASAEKGKGDEPPLTEEQAVMLYALRSLQTCGEDQVS